MTAQKAKIFGNYDDNLPAVQHFLAITFAPDSTSVQQRWNNNGLSADFMADYFAAFFPNDDGSDGQVDTSAEIKSSVSYIANELLENSMKYGDEKSKYPTSIELQLHPSRLIFMATNSVKLAVLERFYQFASKLTTNDPQDLYISQLEDSIASEQANASGLGILTMINDYGAKVGWKVEPKGDRGDYYTLTTMVQLTV
ncbi:hypothetical protein Pse7367_0127 [Thalassoporum mexicanum PCC 7367]|uniref:slr1658 superfamily regulator n=1 Tax=Thalassoporum mexicanum TaxID=3457544 RepID=UPI00029FAE2C|nr:hypothetical protein [Pseudanabaena sp. PCC 7367]AFY68444.1 hypothetical protein Pse7367_0127 [Pseudanabaena sp. PCC 7367]